MILIDISYAVMAFIALFYQILVYKRIESSKGLKFWSIILLSIVICTAGRLLIQINIRWYVVVGAAMTVIGAIREMRSKEQITIGILLAAIGLNFFFWPQSITLVLFNMFNKKEMQTYSEKEPVE